MIASTTGHISNWCNMPNIIRFPIEKRKLDIMKSSIININLAIEIDKINGEVVSVSSPDGASMFGIMDIILRRAAELIEINKIGGK